MEGKPLQLRITISSKLSHVYADEKRLSQFLFNLLHNAIKYSEQGEIIIEASRVKQRRNISQDKGSAEVVRAGSSGPLYEMARPNILIVDEDPVNLKVLANTLYEENYRLTAVSSADEALELIRSASWDLLIADVKMPQMSGHELTKQVRQHFDITELPILLLITHSISEESYTEFLHGANDYVTKPVERLELKYRVQALISLKQSIDQSLRMETAYLQAQIKPHFLFNTINSIMALSEFDMEQMRNVAGAFADYLRYSVDFINTNQLVDLENEISLVKSYIFIEQVRFGDRLTVVWEIQPALRFKLPPLSIQPLVENAVRHGLLSRAKGGELVVRIYQAEAGACVEIIDNGKGIPAAEIENLLSLTRHNTGGIGLRNTNRRLVQRYGQGLLIQSEPGRGTTVSFMIPLDNHPVS